VQTKVGHGTIKKTEVQFDGKVRSGHAGYWKSLETSLRSSRCGPEYANTATKRLRSLKCGGVQTAAWHHSDFLQILVCDSPTGWRAYVKGSVEGRRLVLGRCHLAQLELGSDPAPRDNNLVGGATWWRVTEAESRKTDPPDLGNRDR
jgi:hypothetical protein